jgi:ammonium transporter, Amt family
MTTLRRYSVSTLALLAFVLLAQFAPAADTAPPVGAATKDAAPAPPAYFSGANADKEKPTWPDATGSSAGTWTAPGVGGAADVPAKLSSADLYDRIAHNTFSINIVWTLIAGFLVMFMQAGFAMVETGLCRAKNAAHTISMNFMVYPLG